MENLKGKLKIRFLLLTVFTMFLPTTIFLFLIHAIITKKYDVEAIVMAHMFGAICIPPVIMLVRFFKLISIKSGIITIYYPFLLFVRTKIEIKDITGKSQFERSFFRNPFSWERRDIIHQFSFYKTSKNKYFLISDFNFKNYDEIVSHIDKRTYNIEHVDFFRAKHQIIILIIVFLTVFSLAISAT